MHSSSPTAERQRRRRRRHEPSRLANCVGASALWARPTRSRGWGSCREQPVAVVAVELEQRNENAIRQVTDLARCCVCVCVCEQESNILFSPVRSTLSALS